MTPPRLAIGGRSAAVALLAGTLAIAPSGERGEARAADTVDTESRAGLKVDVDLPHGWEVDLEYQHRTVEGLSTYRGSYYTLEAEYRLAKRVTAIAGYRYATLDEGRASRVRAGVEAKARIGKLRASFRPLVQYRTAIVDDDEVGGDGKTFVRTRLRVEYPVWRRLDVYAFVEPFFGLGGEYPVDNWRNGVGVRYAFSKRADLEVSYIYRPDYGKSYNRLYHIFSLTLGLDVKVKGSSKEEGGQR